MIQVLPLGVSAVSRITLVMGLVTLVLMGNSLQVQLIHSHQRNLLHHHMTAFHHTVRVLLLAG